MLRSKFPFTVLVCRISCFLQVEFQTASGQLLDLITTHEGEKDLSKYTLPVYANSFLNKKKKENV
jgi:hypothetical protein